MATEKRLIDAEHLHRYALYEYMRAKMNHKDEPSFEHWAGIVVAMIEELLKGMPTVDAVEVKHGRWLFDAGSEQYFCSACNEKAIHNSRDFPVYDYDWEENLRYSHTDTLYESFLTNYCPNCGAKMDGDGNDK